MSTHLSNPTSTFDPADLPVTAEEHWPFYAEDEIAAVTAILRSGKVNQWTGTKVTEFQAAYAAYVGNGQAIALANGSLALELPLRAYGIGPGDEVIVTPRTFVASAFCAMLVGATPVFADIDPDSGNITPETISAQITPRTKAVIPVHLAGWPTDMHGICELAAKHDLLVIEDCAQAQGAMIDGKPVGSFGDVASFSFCQDKIITTGGEGGLVIIRDPDKYDWAWSFKDHGKSRDKVLNPPQKPGFRWLHDSVGTNWRMLETSAAIGTAQLAKLSETTAARTERANIWADALGAVDGIRVPRVASPLTSAEYKFYCYVDHTRENAEQLRDAILAGVAKLGIRGFSGSCSEVYREEAFANLQIKRLPIAQQLGETSLMFEVHPTLDVNRLRSRAAAVAEIATSVLSN